MRLYFCTLSAKGIISREAYSCARIAVFGEYRWLEPISKSPEEDNEASELDKAEEVLGVILPVDENTALHCIHAKKRSTSQRRM